jgi:hypothetical protein
VVSSLSKAAIPAYSNGLNIVFDSFIDFLLMTFRTPSRRAASRNFFISLLVQKILGVMINRFGYFYRYFITLYKTRVGVDFLTTLPVRRLSYFNLALLTIALFGKKNDKYFYQKIEISRNRQRL